jgi:hypothetical protein
MGLIYPRDLRAWHDWQQSRSRLRHLAHRWRSEQPLTGVLTVIGERPRTLVILDTLTPTSRLALLEPARHLVGDHALLTAAPLPARAVGPRASQSTLGLAPDEVPETLREVTTVVALGHFLARDAVGYAWSRRLGADFVAVQHGLLTAYAPPLAPDSRLLAWTSADADFWRGGRDDVQTDVVGSQLLWEAGAEAAEVTDDRPTFLGQLHGAEVGRHAMARFTASFVRGEGLRYRPHPSEIDRLSRWQHALWRRRGMLFDESGLPLRDLPTPVVSVFSTGVLEAAARGVPAWVAFDRPPPWLAEFWERYGMSRYGGTPTAVPNRPRAEPAALIAAALEGRG